jgi:hypothetical protein
MEETERIIEIYRISNGNPRVEGSSNHLGGPPNHFSLQIHASNTNGQWIRMPHPIQMDQARIDLFSRTTPSSWPTISSQWERGKVSC